MPEVDFSASIKAKNFDFAPKIQKLGDFALSDKGLKFLEAKAYAHNEKAEKPVSSEILQSVCQNAFESAKNFFRPGISDLHLAIARLNKFLKTGDAKLLTSEFSEVSDLEISLARVSIAQEKLAEKDFKSSAETKVIIEQEDKDSCECEDDMGEEEVEGKKVCASCKKAKAKKNC